MKSREERRRSPRRDEAKADTRRRVLAAALEFFAREGYHGARMDAIAEAAGASKRALYLHFPREARAVLGARRRVRLRAGG
jgi:AcrR family transcriptional regulator